MGSNGGSLAVSQPWKGDIMSHYQEVLDRSQKILTYYENSGLNMEVIACAQDTIKTFERKRETAQERIPGYKEDLDKAQSAYAAWLERQLDCPSKMAQLFADMQKGENTPEILRKIEELEANIELYSEDLNENPKVLAAKKLIEQFEKFRENPQLELKFEQLQQEYKDTCSCKTCIDDGYDYF